MIVTSVYTHDAPGWYCEIRNVQGRIVHVTSMAETQLRAERLAAAWIAEHCDEAACCGL